MAKRRILPVGGSAIAALLFTILAYYTRSDLLGVPFLAPGMLLAAIIFPTGIHSDHPYFYVGLSMILGFLFTWAMLLLLVKLIENLILRRRGQA
jgi:hypothetical protein